MYTRKEISEMCGISITAVINRINRMKLQPCHFENRIYYYSKDNLLEILNYNEKKYITLHSKMNQENKDTTDLTFESKMN